jgi:hypothetical protein
MRSLLSGSTYGGGDADEGAAGPMSRSIVRSVALGNPDCDDHIGECVFSETTMPPADAAASSPASG